jgi:hypothetical protein
MTITIHSTGWACTDCLILLANGETPPEMDEDQAAAWLADIDRITEGFSVVLGGEHDEDCPNMVDGEWSGHTDCYCEREEFSMRQCDVCGSPLGGSRHAVTFFNKA